MAQQVCQSKSAVIEKELASLLGRPIALTFAAGQSAAPAASGGTDLFGASTPPPAAAPVVLAGTLPLPGAAPVLAPKPQVVSSPMVNIR